MRHLMRGGGGGTVLSVRTGVPRRRVLCALGWACWKTYLGGRITTIGCMAMGLLGNGLSAASRDEDALSVKEARLSMMRRVGAPEYNMLDAQSNLASTYHVLDNLKRP